MSPNSKTTLSRREREIMDIVFEAEEASASDVRTAMADPPTDAAVRATLRILVEKGLLKHRHDGPRYIYSPTTSRVKARRKALRHVLQTFFDGSAESAMAALLELRQDKLSNEERDRLVEMIEKARKEGR